MSRERQLADFFSILLEKECSMTEEWGAILVVDDDAEMRELVHDVLKGRGHQVTMAGSGQEALKRLTEQDHAVVLTDLRMKGMSGTELLVEIRRLYPDIGVILMTALRVGRHRGRSDEAGRQRLLDQTGEQRGVGSRRGTVHPRSRITT